MLVCAPGLSRRETSDTLQPNLKFGIIETSQVTDFSRQEQRAEPQATHARAPYQSLPPRWSVISIRRSV